jgi:hypothetical protein
VDWLRVEGPIKIGRLSMTVCLWVGGGAMGVPRHA